VGNNSLGYEILEDNLLVIRYVGSHELEAWFDFVRRAVSDPALSYRYSVVVDYRDSTEVWSVEDLTRLSRFWLSLAPRLVKQAAVSREGFFFGVLRQGEGIAHVVKGSKPNYEPFTDFEEAIQWAKSSD
jgi:hypothetical protein